MKVTITPIGAARGQLGQAAGRVTAYLMGPDAQRSQAGDPVRYYADSVEGPGWWWGSGAARRALTGRVDAAALRTLLEGRDPGTGERLVSASGSAGRASLRVGEATRVLDGTSVWDLDDIARRFDITVDNARDLIGDLPPEVVTVDEAGKRWVGLKGIDHLSDALRVNSAEPVGLDGDPAEMLSVAQCAAITGLSDRYLRRALHRAEQDRDLIAAVGEGAGYDRAYLVGRRRGNRWSVERRELQAFWQRRTPPAVRVAFDAVLTAEKSVSLLTLLAAPAVQTACVDALRAANAAAMDWMDAHASVGRSDGASIDSEGLCGASFLHATSRNLDPHPHVHNLIINAIEDRHGTGRTLDARALYREAKAASALATAEMRWRLFELGGDWHQHGNGVWELAGVNEAAVAEFSTRRRDIDHALAALVGDSGGEATRDEIQRVSAATRGAKQSTTTAALVGEWRHRAAAVGFRPDAILGGDRGLRRSFDGRALSGGQRAELFQFLADDPDGVCQHASTFNRGDVVAAINRWAPGGRLCVLPAAQLRVLAEEFLASELAVPLAQGAPAIQRRDRRPTGRDLEPRWTTPSMVRCQLQIRRLWDLGTSAGAALADPASVDRVAAAVGLNDEQRGLVAAWTTSGHRFQAAVGGPGTGKTYTMAVAAKVWQDAGLVVKGAAVKGTAAQTLARETGLTVETVAWHLQRAREGAPAVDARTVLIVDEASTLSDRDLAELMTVCSAAGTTMRFIGDPSQQQAVGAGGMWAAMVDRHAAATPELLAQRRLRHAGQVAAAEALRAGNVRKAFAQLARNGQLHVVGDVDDLEVTAVSRWMERRGRGRTAPMVDRRNDTRHQLNLLAQAARQALGEIEQPVDVAGRRFAVGDEVIARRPNRAAHRRDSPEDYVANGATGVITAITDDTVTVDFDALGPIPLTAVWCGRHLDLAYAVTAYGIQGATVDELSSIVRPGADLASVYVSLTRGRDVNELVIAGADRAELDSGRSGDPLLEVVSTVAHHTTVPAVVADEELQDLIEHPTRDRGRVTVTTTGPGQASNRLAAGRTERAWRRFVTQPPASINAVLPPRPTVPWLANDWDRAVGVIGAYRTTWRPAPGPGPWGQVLGRRPPEGHQQRQYDQAVAAVVEMAVNATLRALAGHAGHTSLAAREPYSLGSPCDDTREEQAEWVPAYLAHLATTGQLTRTSVEHLATWINSVTLYRHRNGITDTPADQPLGPEPATEELTEQHHRLTVTAPTQQQNLRPRLRRTVPAR